MTERKGKERERERRLRRADEEKYISGKQAETLLKREIRKVMGKVKARSVCVCVCLHLMLYFEALTFILSACYLPPLPFSLQDVQCLYSMLIYG